MEESNLEARVAKVEGILNVVREDVEDIKSVISDKFDSLTKALESLDGRIETAVTVISNSLSMPVLKDVLVPIIMKLFLFFAGLVLMLVCAILGIKWAFNDILKIMGNP